MRVHISECEFGLSAATEAYELAELIGMPDDGDPDGKAEFLAIVPRLMAGEMVVLGGGAQPLCFLRGVL